MSLDAEHPVPSDESLLDAYSNTVASVAEGVGQPRGAGASRIDVTLPEGTRHLHRLLDAARIGQDTSLDVLRGSRRVTLQVTPEADQD
ncbi:MAG TPA: hypothetical protein VFX59_30965 [Polyangiales bacterium]|nr:hypothetical protein [Polyangiales bacterium]